MDAIFHHCHHRIDGHYETWTVFSIKKLRSRHGQMTSCRETYDSYLISIDAVVLCVTLHITDGLQQIILSIRVSVTPENLAVVENKCRNIRRAIVKHKRRDTLLLHSPCHAIDLCLCVMPDIVASRTDDNRQIATILCEIRRQHNLLLTGCALPDIHLPKGSE